MTLPRIVIRGPAASMGERYGVGDAPLDFELCCEQWADYWDVLMRAGLDVLVLPPDDDLPDCCFVEDTVVVSGGRALLANMSAPWRAGEPGAVATYLTSLGFEVVTMRADARLDGGDVLRIGQTAFVGLSKRTDPRGFDEVSAFLARDGYTAVPVPVADCLHLKSAVTQVAEDTVLLNPAWTQPSVFGTCRVVEVDPGEPLGANALFVEGRCVLPRSAPRTAERLGAMGIEVTHLDMSELEKAGGGLTCLSVLLDG